VSLSGLAHYIKNILFTSQIGEYLVDKGLNEWNDLDRVREGWTTLHQANQKIRKLVENMLNYSRKTQLEFKPVNLVKMITEIVDSVQDQAALRRTDVQAQIDPELESVMLEPESIYDALLNLVTNAMDAIPEGRIGKVIVRAQRIPDQNNFKVEVLDSGMGIPEEYRDKVFNLFFSTKGKKGTGIGLAATRKIIEDHSGSIEFDTTPGQGTCFRVFLPLKRAE
jgi:signal transduction histidine kinase